MSFTYVTEFNTRKGRVCVYVDYKRRITKYVGELFTCFYYGIYPNHDPECYKRLHT